MVTNVDRFDVRYDDLASTLNTENRRKPAPQGNKQKFTQRGRASASRFQKNEARDRGRAASSRRRPRAQLKVLIPDEITVGRGWLPA